MIRAALLFAGCLAAGGAGAEVCLMPLEGGAPVNEVEQRQPYRIYMGPASFRASRSCWPRLGRAL